MASLNVGPQYSDEEKYQLVEKHIDQLFPFLPTYDDFYLDDAIDQAFKEERGLRSILFSCQEQFRNFLRGHGYIQQGIGGNIVHRLTEKGRAVKNLGGHNASIKQQQQAQAKAAEEEDLKYKELRLNVQKLENELKDYKQTKWNATAAIWVSIASLVASIIIGLLQVKSN